MAIRNCENVPEAEKLMLSVSRKISEIKSWSRSGEGDEKRKQEVGERGDWMGEGGEEGGKGARKTAKN